MNINSTLFIQVIVFLVLIAFTMKKIWPPLAKALDERAAKIAAGLKAADDASAAMANTRQQIDQQLAQTRAECSTRLADAERLAQSIVDEAKGKANDEGQKIRLQAQQEAGLEMGKVRDQLREQVALLAVKGAEQILRREVKPADHAELLNRLKSEL
ncbi:F0F1 ATP synthase subunit B [Amphibiibacter pelophylacis]|uniref:F0F1 ATP synthase subunit B n=1 Tax=Amphibiibacter pelophylacis TaxID=1799477 RepID=A0ACC6P206_9BURK